jgi:CBS domain containing-hemolysin-like protein
MQQSPGSIPVAVGLTLVLALVLANAFFVAAEFALVGSRKTRLDEMIRAGDRKAILARKAIQSLDRYISATQLGITLASLGLGWVGEPALAHLFEGLMSFIPGTARLVAAHSIAVAFAFAVITVLHIVIGELMPKALALLFPEDVSRWTAAPLMGFAFVMAFPIRILNGAAIGMLSLFRIKPPTEHERVHSPEEIRMLVTQSQEGGSLHKDDARLLAGVFEFSEKNAEQVMTPRTDIVALEGGMTVDQAADVVANAQRSRYPVHTESLDEIVGVVHAKDILRTLRQAPGSMVSSIARTPLLVPGTREVEDVLADMKRLKSHMAIVLDEYGGTAGLVTMEDLLEEIVGEIYDEYDPVQHPVAPGTAPTVDGAMPITDFNTQYAASLDDTDYTTVGGYLVGQLGRLPRLGDRGPAAGMTFEIVAMDGRRVKTVRMEKVAKPAGR